jgi:VanZ family protein
MRILASGAVWLVRLAWAALAVYWIFMLLQTHLPSPWSPVSGVPHSDKLLHFMGFGVLGGLLTLVLAWRIDRAGKLVAELRSAWPTAIVVAALYGLLDEATQPFTGRTFQWADWFADIAGAAAGTAGMAALVLTGRLQGRRRATGALELESPPEAGAAAAGLPSANQRL